MNQDPESAANPLNLVLLLLLIAVVALGLYINPPATGGETRARITETK
jgi:hypothetical protein